MVIHSTNEMRHKTIFLCSLPFFSYMNFKWFMFVSRFWAAIDPDEMDEEASSLEKHQSISLQSAVNCEKKASYKILIFISSIYFVKHFNNMYAIPGRH